MNASILFVCLGNICRSPLAEGAMRAEIERRDLTLEIDSAGTGHWHIGEPPDPRAIAVAHKNGVDIGGQRARQISRHDFKRFDYIVAMDDSVFASLQAMAPSDSGAALSLFLDHVDGRQGQSVADPYYGGVEGFAVAWAEVTEGARALADALAGR